MAFSISGRTNTPIQSFRNAVSPLDTRSGIEVGPTAQNTENQNGEIEHPRGMPQWMLTHDALLHIPAGTARVSATVVRAETIVAKDGGNAAARFLGDPHNAALLAEGTAAIAGAQLIPGVGEAVDLAAGVASVAMYAAAGPEHRERITQAVGELRSYLGDVSSAHSQSDLDRASGHLARFMEIGGAEAGAGLLAIGGAATAPARFAELTKDVAANNTTATLSALAEKVGGYLDEVSHGLGRLGDAGLTPAYAGGNAQVFEMRSVAVPHGGNVGGSRGNFELDEMLGGHTKSLHIGKSDEQLRSRLKQDSDIKIASTFTSEAIANKAISVFLKKNRSSIEQWSANPRMKEAFKATTSTDFPIGRVLNRGGSEARTSNKFFAMLVKDESPRGWHILTAYPK